jgi:hypothetical protein
LPLFPVFPAHNQKHLKQPFRGGLDIISDLRGRIVVMSKDKVVSELEHMFREDLIVACQYWGVDVSSSKSGDSLIQMLAEKMMNPKARDKLFATFTPRERDLLGILVLNGGAMSYDKLKPFRKLYSYGQLNQTERDLRKKGIIIRRMMTRVTDFGREVAEFKVMDFFTPHLNNLFTARPEPELEKPKHLRKYENHRDTLIVDVLILLSYLAKNEVRMTTTWEFPKREADRIMEAMSTPTEDRFDLVQKFARKAGAYSIIEEDRAVPSKVEVLFAGKYIEVARRFLVSALGRTRAIWATPDQPTEYTLNLIICRLREAAQEDWIRVTELRDWIRSELFLENQPLKWLQVDDERVAIALETPILLGLVEAAYKGKKLIAVSLTQTGEFALGKKQPEEKEEHDTFFVSPNFELTVFTSEMNYEKLYRLLLITTPIKTDVVSTFKITDKSIFQAIEVGLREDDIVGFLTTESNKPVPNNVLRSIKDWTSQTTYASVSDVSLFETENEQDLENLLLYKEFSKYVVRRVGPQAVIVSGDLEELSDDLRKHKCKVTVKGKESAESVEIPTSTITEQVLLFGDQALVDLPEACIACPAAQSCNRVIRRRAESKRGKTK